MEAFKEISFYSRSMSDKKRKIIENAVLVRIQGLREVLDTVFV